MRFFLLIITLLNNYRENENMTWINIKDMTIEQLEFAVGYSQVLRSIIKDRKDVRPLKADHEAALEHLDMIKSNRVKIDELIITPFLSLYEISVFKDNKWFAFSPDSLSVGMRDQDGTTTLFMSYPEDAYEGDTLEEAVLRCFVAITLTVGGMEFPD